MFTFVADFQYSVFEDALNFASNIKQIKFKRINQLQFPRKSSYIYILQLGIKTMKLEFNMSLTSLYYAY